MQARNSDLHKLPSDLLVKISLFAGATATTNLAKAYSDFAVHLISNEKTIQRGTDSLLELAELGEQVICGHQQAVKTALEAAKKNGTLTDLLNKKTIATYHSGMTLSEMTLLQIALWALDEKMVTLIAGFMSKLDIAQQKLAMLSANLPCVDTTSLTARFTELNTAAAKIDWPQFVAGSDEDLHLQQLFQLVIAEQASLPLNFTQETLHATQPFYVNGKLQLLNAKTLPRINNVITGETCDLRKPECLFGKTFGVLRGGSQALAVKVTDIAQYVRPDAKTQLSLAQMTANGFSQMTKNRLTWFNKQMNRQLLESQVNTDPMATRRLG